MEVTNRQPHYGVIFRPSKGREKGYAMHLAVPRSCSLEEVSRLAREKSLEPNVRKTTVIDYDSFTWAAQEHWIKGQRIPTLFQTIRNLICN